MFNKNNTQSPKIRIKKYPLISAFLASIMFILPSVAFGGVKIYYIKAGASAGGNGSLFHPFDDVSDLATTKAGDIIVFLPSANTLQGKIVLKNNQTLLGFGKVNCDRSYNPALDRCTGISQNSKIENPSGNAIELAKNNIVSGINIISSSRFGIYGLNPGFVILTDNQISKTNTIGARLACPITGTEMPTALAGIDKLNCNIAGFVTAGHPLNFPGNPVSSIGLFANAGNHYYLVVNNIILDKTGGGIYTVLTRDAFAWLTVDGLLMKGTASTNNSMVFAIPGIGNQLHDQSKMIVNITHTTLNDLGVSDSYEGFTGLLRDDPSNGSTASLNVNINHVVDIGSASGNTLTDGFEFTSARGAGTDMQVTMRNTTLTNMWNNGIKIVVGNRIPGDPLGPFGVGTAKFNFKGCNRIYDNNKSLSATSGDVTFHTSTAAYTSGIIADARYNWWGNSAGLLSNRLIETLDGSIQVLNIFDASSPLTQDPLLNPPAFCN